MEKHVGMKAIRVGMTRPEVQDHPTRVTIDEFQSVLTVGVGKIGFEQARENGALRDCEQRRAPPRLERGVTLGAADLVRFEIQFLCFASGAGKEVIELERSRATEFLSNALLDSQRDLCRDIRIFTVVDDHGHLCRAVHPAIKKDLCIEAAQEPTLMPG
jgi:hypothetical protein